MLDDPFTLHYASNLLKPSRHIATREPYLREACDVRELRTALLKKNNCPPKAESTLKEADLVHNVRARVKRAIESLFLGSQYQESESSAGEHFVQPLRSRDSGDGLPVEFIPRQPETISYEVFEFSPKW